MQTWRIKALVCLYVCDGGFRVTLSIHSLPAEAVSMSLQQPAPLLLRDHSACLGASSLCFLQVSEAYCVFESSEDPSKSGLMLRCWPKESFMPLFLK